MLEEIEALKGEVAALKAKKPVKVEQKTDDKLAKKIKAMDKKINKVRAHDANDNIKFSLDFRNTLDNIEYTYNDYVNKARPDDTGAKKQCSFNLKTSIKHEVCSHKKSLFSRTTCCLQ